MRRLALADERFLVVRTMMVRCAPGLRTTSPTLGWHRLMGTSRGIIIARTARGRWPAPPDAAVWVPAGEHAELETCAETSLWTLYVRDSRAGWARDGVPRASCPIGVSALLRELVARVADLGFLDRRTAWHVCLLRLLLHEVRNAVREPRTLAWPRDPRAARVAAIVQADPGDARPLRALCRGQGASVRTIQRLFPLDTGLTFDAWRAQVRLLHACGLLAEGRRVGDVASACGYRGASAFVAAFRRATGVTPGKFLKPTQVPDV